MKNWFNFLVIFLSSYYCTAQSIHKEWYLEERKTCVIFDSTKKCLTISDFWEHECYRIKYKVKGDVLRLKFKASQYIYGWSKQTYYYKILELTDKSLKLYIEPVDEDVASRKTPVVLLEILGDGEIKFIYDKQNALRPTGLAIASANL